MQRAKVNQKFIISNVKSVFKHRDIDKLSKASYQFIITYMGFIAHYDLGGFQAIYQNLDVFAERLQTSEYSCDLDYNLHHAKRYITDTYFAKDYGKEYIESVSETIKGIVEISRQFKPYVQERLV